jgi:glyoxylase-like metal-dependent hydrolase (beta-lactamase superfamily II)
MSSLSASVLGIYQLRWTPTPGHSPQQSGVYLTRNERDEDWFRYFDARLGDWYRSWAEMKARALRGSTRIDPAETAREVVAWAQRTRRARAA